MRDLLFIVPLVAAAIAASVVAGRWGALAVLAVAVLGRTASVAMTGASSSMRRLGIRFVRAGTREVPERWRLVAHQLGPFLLVGVLLVVGGTAPAAFPVALAAYLVVLMAGWWRGRRLGVEVDPVLALAGLDVWWAGDPPTPSGTSGRPAPEPPPPTPAAPATPAPARRRGRRGRR